MYRFITLMDDVAACIEEEVSKVRGFVIFHVGIVDIYKKWLNNHCLINLLKSVK